MTTKEKCMNYGFIHCKKDCSNCTLFETREEYNRRMEQATWENRGAINW